MITIHDAYINLKNALTLRSNAWAVFDEAVGETNRSNVLGEVVTAQLGVDLAFMEFDKAGTVINK